MGESMRQMVIDCYCGHRGRAPRKQIDWCGKEQAFCVVWFDCSECEFREAGLLSV